MCGFTAVSSFDRSKAQQSGGTLNCEVNLQAARKSRCVQRRTWKVPAKGSTYSTSLPDCSNLSTLTCQQQLQNVETITAAAAAAAPSPYEWISQRDHGIRTSAG